jgi:polyphosphate glucokinase
MPTPSARGATRARTPAAENPRSPLATAARTGRRRGPGLPRTLSFDIGGTGLKASVLSSHGELLHEPVRTPTPYPLRPEQLVAALAGLTTGLPTFQRVSAGFPGMMRAGRVLSAPHFISPTGPEGKPSADLVEAWTDFDLQGSALVKGQGLELVITLGTGVGTALFWEGKLAPHLELAQHPLGKGERTYNEVLGEAVRAKVGNKKWNARVAHTLAILKGLVFYDHCYIGGGNSKRVTIDLPPDVSLADNTAGILGGIKLWERT